nr:hypothetical protein CFP56_73311 [Quercus suber]
MILAVTTRFETVVLFASSSETMCEDRHDIDLSFKHHKVFVVCPSGWNVQATDSMLTTRLPGTSPHKAKPLSLSSLSPLSLSPTSTGVSLASTTLSTPPRFPQPHRHRCQHTQLRSISKIEEKPSTHHLKPNPTPRRSLFRPKSESKVGVWRESGVEKLTKLSLHGTATSPDLRFIWRPLY